MAVKTYRVPKLAVSLFSLILFISTTAHAKTIYVDDDGPADFDNIQAAIDDSNDGDTIIVNPGTYTGAGNRDILFNGKAITVRSIEPSDPNIVASTIIDCNGTKEEPHRGFFFNSEEANSVLAGLTITNGYADYGGGINCEGSRPTITNCNIIGNRTGLNWFSSSGGGGISCRFCFLKGPSLPGKASGPYPSDGAVGPPPFISLMWTAGFFAESHDVYFGTTSPPPFVCNQTSTIFDPGTMDPDTTYYWRVDELNTLGKTIGDEWSFTTGSGLPPPLPPPPGALVEQSSPQVLTETNMSGPTIQNCIIIDNFADEGGGMYTQNSKPILSSCTFSDNYADDGGGGLFTERSNPVLVNCDFISNSTFSFGGGLLCIDGNTILTNCSFSDNYSHYGGGVFNSYDSNTTMTDCIFSDNLSSDHGGGIYNDANSRTNLNNCTFTGNTVLYEDPFSGARGCGGGIYNNHCNSRFTNCTFSKNSASIGGGICSIFDSNTVLIDCIFKKNLADVGGGTFNSAGGDGGGMFNGGGYSKLSNCVFSGNIAEDKGGGMYNAECSPTLKNCTFSGNVAEYLGGHPWPPWPPPVYGFGGAMYNYYSSAKLINCTFTGNRAHEEGGAIWWLYSGPRSSLPPPPHFTGSANTGLGLVENLSITDCNDINVPMISNCIFWDNRDSNGIEEISQIRVDPNKTPITINYSSIQGWTGTLGGTGNIDVDPCFVQPGYWSGSLYFYSFWYEGYYQLMPESLCIDVGDPNYIAEPNETDLDGRPRVIDGRIDMGAYEYQGPGQERMFYVDDDAIGANNGSSWADAFNYLQDALAAAQYGDQVFVAQGIYKPDRGHRVVPGDREATFWLRNGLAIIGGYAGAGSPDPNTRNKGLYETILSGDLDGNDVEVLDPCDLLYEPTRVENSYIVVTGSGTNETALLDGFTITSGFYGGLHNQYSSATVNNCTFTDNGGSVYGAAMANWGSSSVATNCTFASNYCGMQNRRWYLNRRSSPILTNCTFSGNSGGGGMINDRRDPILLNCIFNGNISYQSGGGLYNIFSNPILTNCLFNANVSLENGGALHNYRSNSILTNCTLSGNWAVSFGGGIFNERSDTSLTNCILWGNTSPEGQGQAAQIYGSYHPVINYCCIEGWTGDLGGSGNIGTDPCFVEPGCWDVNGVCIEGDYHLLLGSPCIDAGDPDYMPEHTETDLDGRPRIIGDRIDMGAYEFQGPRDPCVFYVDDDATGANNGSSWADAFNFLQDALTEARYGDTILVAQGTYKPDQRSGLSRGDCLDTFRLKRGVAIVGGYGGFTEQDPNVRNIDSYKTILSGDIGKLGFNGDNSYHVVTSCNTDTTAVLDGFTITSGHAKRMFYTSNFWTCGGGMYSVAASPSLLNCIFTANSAWSGGGLYNLGGRPMLNNCKFSDNSATGVSYRFGRFYIHRGNGGGMYNLNGAPMLENCSFRDNSAGERGGGLYNYQGSPAIIHCMFSDNSADSHGGGMYSVFNSSAILTNCSFSGNMAFKDGGGMYSERQSSDILINCLFSGNMASVNGGALYSGQSSTTLNNCTLSDNWAGAFGGGICNEGSDAYLSNCILWGDSAVQGSEIYLGRYIDYWGEVYPSTMDVNYSDIVGWYTNIYVDDDCTLNWGSGNIDADPCFVQPGYWQPPLPPRPAQASDPYPFDGATNVNPTVDLRWLAGAYSASHDVYFGTANPPPFICNQASITFDPGMMAYNTTYYWRIDELNISGITAGDVWSFTTGSLPGKAGNPNPANHAHNVGINADLSWTAGSGAISHDVYFGTISAPPFVCNQTSTTYEPGLMNYSTTYYWRINEVSDSVITVGDIWSFTTIMAPPLLLPLIPPPSPTILVASYVSDNEGYVWIEGNYHLQADSPCIDIGDPNYTPEPNETDLDGKPRVINGRVDMGAYEYSPPIQADVRIVPRTINLASKGEWIMCYIWLPQDYNEADIDPNSVFLKFLNNEFESRRFWLTEDAQVAAAKFDRDQVQAVLTAGEIELTIIGRLTDGTVFEGTDVVTVIDRCRRTANANSN